MQKFVKQVMVVGAVVGMGVSTCTVLANAEDGSSTTSDVRVNLEADGKSVVLVKAPSFDFGDRKLSGSRNENYIAEKVKDTLIVRNPGFTSGWTVNASWQTDSKQKSTSDFGGMTLTLTPKTENIKYTSGTSVSDNMPKVIPSVTIGTDPSHVFIADTEKGIGTYELTINKEDTNLLVPADTKAGEYTPKITWSMENAPTGQNV